VLITTGQRGDNNIVVVPGAGVARAFQEFRHRADVQA
jgi:hypothetical protein